MGGELPGGGGGGRGGGCRRGGRGAAPGPGGSGRTLDVLLSEEVSLSLADAYRVQDQVTALRLAEGERLAGWKLDAAVMRAQMGIAAPNFGR